MVNPIPVKICSESTSVVPFQGQFWGATSTVVEGRRLDSQDFRADQSTKLKAKEVLSEASKKWPGSPGGTGTGRCRVGRRNRRDLKCP